MAESCKCVRFIDYRILFLLQKMHFPATQGVKKQNIFFYPNYLGACRRLYIKFRFCKYASVTSLNIVSRQNFVDLNVSLYTACIYLLKASKSTRTMCQFYSVTSFYEKLSIFGFLSEEQTEVCFKNAIRPPVTVLVYLEFAVQKSQETVFLLSVLPLFVILPFNFLSNIFDNCIVLV